MSTDIIRVGVVGAGENTRVRHIPGLRAQLGVEVVAVANRSAESGVRAAQLGVEVVAVANRSAESGVRAAQELGIPRACRDWQELVALPDVDAVMIGTWPNLHCEVTCAALAAGKHVLVEARMARDVDEAQRMLAASRARPELIAQIVPSPAGLECGTTVTRLLAEGFLGDVRELVVLGVTSSMWDDAQPVHWRQDAAISGRNVLALGILHETVLRWLPQPERVLANTALFSRRSPAPGAPAQTLSIPDVVHVLTELPGGARGVYHLSGVALFGPPLQVHLYGSRGTIKIEFGETERVWVGQAGEPQLREFSIPAAERGGWRVEAEFVAAIRGQEKVRYTDFATGLRYMQFTDAVLRSAESGAAVSLDHA